LTIEALSGVRRCGNDVVGRVFGLGQVVARRLVGQECSSLGGSVLAARRNQTLSGYRAPAVVPVVCECAVMLVRGRSR